MGFGVPSSHVEKQDLTCSTWPPPAPLSGLGGEGPGYWSDGGPAAEPGIVVKSATRVRFGVNTGSISGGNRWSHSALGCAGLVASWGELAGDEARKPNNPRRAELGRGRAWGGVFGSRRALARLPPARDAGAWPSRLPSSLPYSAGDRV